jgi:hypothetical protein
MLYSDLIWSQRENGVIICRVVNLDIGDLRIRDVGDTLNPSTFGALTELSLSWNTLTSVRGLLSLPRLRVLNLEGNRLGSGSPPLFSRSVTQFTSNSVPVWSEFSPASWISSPEVAGISTAPGSATAWGGNDRHRYDLEKVSIILHDTMLCFISCSHSSWRVLL